MWWCSDQKTRALQARVDELEGQLLSTEEAYEAVRQKADTAEVRMHTMELHRAPGDLAKIVLGLAEDIENIFARGGLSRYERLNQVSGVVRRGIERALLGEKHWQS